MKTKHIFGTILMATFAVACSNEDLQLVENPTQVGERIELGDVTLSLGEAESRFVVGDNFNDLDAELNDKVGAALIDAPNSVGSDKDAKYNYDLTSYISSNYAFEYNGSVWTTPAKMVEGNYMFYAPYNAEHATRKPIVAKLDAVQQLTATADGIDELSTIKQMIASGNVMAVSHEFLAASDEANVQTALVPVYAYPYITLTNNFMELNAAQTAYVPADLIVNQIVIRKSSGEFVIEAPFEFEAGKTAITADDDFVYGLRDFTYWKNADNTNVALKGAFAKSLGKGAYTSDILGSTDTKESSAIVVKAPANGLSVAKSGGTVSFYAVIPADEYADGLIVDVYTNKGVFTKEIAAAAISAGKRYPEAEYNEDGTATIVPSEGGEAAKGELFTVTMEEPTDAEATLVATTADLLTLIQNTTANNQNPLLTINTLTKDVQITSAVMNAIKAKSYSGWSVVFNTPVTIATSLNSSNKYITFKGGAEITSGTIELNNKVKFIGSADATSDLTIKGGTVTVDAGEFTNATIVNNGGTVTLKSLAYAENKSGTLTIAASWNDPATITNNGGTITYVNGTSSSKKTYTNNVINNSGTVTVPAYAIVSNITNGDASGNENTALLNVLGTATVGTNAATDGKITVTGTVNVVDNNNLIVMDASGATANVTNNNSYINNTKNGTVVTTTTEGNIYYEFSEDVDGRLIAKSSNYNMIVLNGMTWSPEASQTISVNVELREATIAVWDSEIVIDIDGNLTTYNTNNNTKSKVEGVDGAVVYAYTLPEADFTNAQGIAKVQAPAETEE